MIRAKYSNCCFCALAYSSCWFIVQINKYRISYTNHFSVTYTIIRNVSKCFYKFLQAYICIITQQICLHTREVTRYPSTEQTIFSTSSWKNTRAWTIKPFATSHKQLLDRNDVPSSSTWGGLDGMLPPPPFSLIHRTWLFL